MSSKTDLAGLLRNEEGCLHHRMLTWFSEGDPKRKGEPPALPALIRIWYKSSSSGSWEQIDELPIQAIPTTPDTLVDAVEKAIVDRFGPSPMGQIRIRGWGQGCASSPGLDITRTIGQGDEALEVSFLRERVAQLDRHNRELIQQNTTLATGAMTLAASLGNSLMGTATTRAVSSSAADVSGMGGMLGMITLLMFRRHIEASFSGSKDDPLTRFGDKMLGFLNGDPPETASGKPGAAPQDPIAVLLADAELGPRVRALLTDPKVEQLVKAKGFMALLTDQEIGPKLQDVLNDPRAGQLLSQAMGIPPAPALTQQAA